LEEKKNNTKERKPEAEGILYFFGDFTVHKVCCLLISLNRGLPGQAQKAHA
jgi:hypothetical protein